MSFEHSMNADQREIARYETALENLPLDDRIEQIEKALAGPLPDGVRAYLRTTYLNLTDPERA